jgi:4-hydroxybenzoate polyprenyltransferase
MLKDILQIVRYKNLIVVAATMYVMRLFIMNPLLEQKGMELQLDEYLFLLLTLATVCITAAGYAINDYFDKRTDMVNRPETVIVDKKLSRRAVISLHWTLNAFGVLFGSFVAIAIGKTFLVLVFLLIPGILWFYSTTYKRQFLLGNFIVASLTAMVPLMNLLFELPKLQAVYWQELLFSPKYLNNIIYWVGGYTIFAFLLTLFREIVKDIEDFEGDKKYGHNTLPIVLGVKTTRSIASSILLLTIITLVYLFGAYLNFLPSGKFDYFTLFYIIFALVMPMFLLIVKLLTSSSKDDYHKVSSYAKLIMLIGILYAIPFNFLLT